MKNKRIWVYGAGLALVLAMFAGCGGHSGEKEYNKAIKAWNKGNLVQARTLFEKATGRMSGNAKKSMALNKLGLVLWQLNEPQAAAEAFNDACLLSDTITDARLNLAMAQFHSGDLEGAAKSLSMYLGEYPETPNAMTLSSMIAAKKRDWNQSSRIMAKVAANQPNDPAAQNALALAELNQGNGSNQAIKRLKKTIATHPDYAPALYNLAVIYDQWLRDKTTARHYYQAYLQKAGDSGSHGDAATEAVARLGGDGSATTSTDPAEAVQFMKAGARLHSQKKYTEAVEEFKKAIAVDPRQKNAYYNMGLAYYSLRKYTEAAQACRNALSIDPRFADARYMLALSYVQQRQWDNAEREGRELSKIDQKRGKDLLDHIANAR